MYSRLTAFGGSALFLLFSHSITAEEGALITVVPDRCISLHKGQVCYQDLSINWSLPLRADVCIHQDNLVEPLQCWSDALKGKMKVDFQSSSPLSYSLRYVGQPAPLTSSTVNIAWVYKNSKKQTRTWRLF